MTELFWPKFSEFQEFESSRRGNPGQSEAFPLPSSAPAPAPAQRTGLEHEHSPPKTPVQLPAKVPSKPTFDFFKPDQNLVPANDAIDMMASRLANILNREPGAREGKTTWLADNLPLMICEVAALPNIATRQQANAKLCSLAIRWWRQELRNPGGNGRPAPESFDEKRIRTGRAWLLNL